MSFESFWNMGLWVYRILSSGIGGAWCDIDTVAKFTQMTEIKLASLDQDDIQIKTRDL